MPYFIIQGPKPLIGGNPYVGPGDLVPGARVWWGLRGYNAAYCTGGNPCLDCVDASTGLNPTTINITTDGNFDTATYSAKVTSNGSQVVTKLYDQTGGGNHMLQGTLAQMPPLSVFSVVPPGILRYDIFNFANQRLVTAGSIVQAQPFTVSYVDSQIDFGANNGLIEDLDTNGFMFAVGPAINQIQMFNGTNVVISSTDSVNHSWQFIANGSSSIVVVDSTVNVVNPGTGGSNGRLALFQRGAGATAASAGRFCEAGMWNGAFNSTQYTAMAANQAAFWPLP